MLLASVVLSVTVLARPVRVAADTARRTGGIHALPATITLGRSGAPVPTAFSGLSVEYNELPRFEAAGTLFDRMIALMRPPGGRRLLLRIGGMSADTAYWLGPAAPSPRWVFRIDQRWLGALVALVRRDNLDVMFDLNLAVHSPTMAVSFARAVVQALGRDRVHGFAVGNEPDLYRHEPRLEQERIASTLPATPRHWTRRYAPAEYRADYDAYARALARALPGVPVLAGEMTAFRPEWVTPLADGGVLRPRGIAVHAYGSSNCWPPSLPYYPTIPWLLGPGSTTALGAGLARAAIYADRMRMSFRVTEFNSTSCGGRPGVTDSFASALWALDALFAMLRAGVDGINWHVRPGMINAPFLLTGRGVAARPELYGMAVFAQMTQPDRRLVAMSRATARGLHLSAWATSSRSSTTVLLLNKGARTARVTLELAGTATSAVVRRLRAASVGSRSGITLAGRSIASDGLWHGQATATRLLPAGAAYHVLVPGYSGAVIDLEQPARPA